MANTETSPGPYKKELGVLTAALAEKGTGGLILLAIILLVVWAVPFAFVSFYFAHLPEVQAVGEDTIWEPRYYVAVLGILTIVTIGISAWLTRGILGSIGPTLRAEAEASRLMSQAFGGRILTAQGRLAMQTLNVSAATKRIKRILGELVTTNVRTIGIGNSTLVRANISATPDGRWLGITKGFHTNMTGGTVGVDELTLKVLVGFFSSGTAYRYFRPVLSIKSKTNSNSAGGSTWDHAPQPEDFRAQRILEDVIKEALEEVKKAHADLSWIVSMPIPFQVQPFRMACGVLNVDGLVETPHRDQIIRILADTATAAALIGVINQATNILEGKCSHSDDVEEGGRLEERFGISPDEFDPAECPEPSEEFKTQLATIKGLEFFKRITTMDVAEFLREQLRL